MTPQFTQEEQLMAEKIEVEFGLGGPAAAPVWHRFGEDAAQSPNPSGHFWFAFCGAEVIPMRGGLTPTAILCPTCESAPRAEADPIHRVPTP